MGLNERSIVRVMSLALRSWQWMVAGSAIAVVLAGYVIVSAPTVYTASADFVPKRARTEVSYDSRIRTVSSDSASSPTGAGGTATGSLGIASAERRQALALLMRNPDIEKTVQQQLNDRLPASLKRPGALLRLVSGRVSPRSEIITLTVQAEEASVASDVASAWAQAYLRHTNQLYVSAGPVSREGIQQELITARAKYEEAEQALNRFVSSSPMADLVRTIEYKQASARAMTAIRIQLNYDYERLVEELKRVEAYISTAQALRDQLMAARDDGAASNGALALMLLKAQAFAPQSQAGLPSQAGTAQGTPPDRSGRQADGTQSGAVQGGSSAGYQLHVSVPTTVTLRQQRDDSVATVQALVEWRTRLRDELAQTIDQLSRGLPPEIEGPLLALEQEIRSLQAEQAAIVSRRADLQQNRDLAFETYSAINKKAEEARVEGALGAGEEVALASQAVMVQQVPRRSVVTLLPVAAVLGAAVAAVVAALINYLTALYRTHVAELSSPTSNATALHDTHAAGRPLDTGVQEPPVAQALAGRSGP